MSEQRQPPGPPGNAWDPERQLGHPGEPPSFQGVSFEAPVFTGRDPHAAFGEAPPPHTSIDAYRAPRPRTVLIGALAGIAVIVLALAALLVARPLTTAPPIPAPTILTTSPPAASSSAAASSLPSSGSAGVDFVGTSEDSAGHWAITRHTWTSSGLLIDVTIRCTQGPMSYGFFVFNNETAESSEASSEGHPQALVTGDLGQGRTLTGEVFFPMTRGDATIILSTSTGDQVSALTVAG